MAYTPTLIDFEGSDADNLPSAGSKININLGDIETDLLQGALAQSFVPHGRLFVPPVYYNTGSDTAVQLDSANDWAATKFIAEADYELNFCATYITAVASAGDITIELYSHDATNNKPNASLAVMRIVSSGSSADVWLEVYLSLNRPQLQRGTTYWIVFKGSAAPSDYSLSCNRWNTVLGSMFPDTMLESKISVDGGSNWTSLTVDSKPALLNIMLRTANVGTNVPLLYGRYNGKYIYLPGTGVREIPEAGIKYDVKELDSNTLYYVYLYDSSGTLTLDCATTVPTLTEGILVKTGATTRRYLGMIYTKDLLPGEQGPVDVMDSRLVRNHYNEPEVMIGKANPYSSDTGMTLSAGSWRSFANNGDDFRCDFLAMPGEILQVVAGDVYVIPAGSEVYVDMGIGVDSKTPNEYSASTGIRVNSADVRQSMSAYYNGPVAAGVHSVWPVAYISSVSLGAIGLRNTYAGNIQFAWHGRVGK